MRSPRIVALLLLLGAPLAGCIGNVESVGWPLHAVHVASDYTEARVSAAIFPHLAVRGCGCQEAQADALLQALLPPGEAAMRQARSSLDLPLEGSSLGLALDVGGAAAEREATRVALVDLQLPVATPTFVDGGAGDVAIDGMSGPVGVTLSSGALSVVTSGAATTTTTSGDQQVTAAGRLEATASSGSVRAQAASGSVRVTSGDIDVGWTPSRGDVLQLSSTSGTVRVTVPGSAGFTYRIDVGSGDISVAGVRSTGRSQRGTVGDGGAQLVVTTTSGDVTIE